jgi:hypothetical protein
MATAEDPVRIHHLLDTRLRKLRARGPVMVASLTESRRTCGRYGCRCYRGEKHISHRLTFKEGGRTQSIYVPVGRVEEVRGWVAEARRLQALLRECSELAIVLLRGYDRAEKKPRRRAK